MQTSVLNKTTVSAEDFQALSIHGRRMAMAVIAVAHCEALSHHYAKDFLWGEEGLPPAKERLYPQDLLDLLFQQPIDVRCAIAAELCYGLAADEEVIQDEAA